ncbi:hypothetical protein PILCRDRAFT_14796 [Piloderma croceum F 1598]|uniref:Uncharacterized protein n=1 Tax=Piloderma croceum (strain F 1598) TaxID=765440 RepID=A0A0C3F1D0_PILCF|nr:hypothetical protein PILCRDRAFT_14796 [Piloderma croceum F 1598]
MSVPNARNIDARGAIINDVHGPQFNIGQLNQGNNAETVDFHHLLSPVGDAAFNRGGHVARCHPGTREELIAKIIRWSDGGNQTEIGSNRSICWLSGSAGSGKSAVSQTFAEYCEDKKRLGASFFFLRGAKDRSAFARFISTLSHQLSVSIPATKPRIHKAMRDEPSIPQRALRHQFKKLMLQPILRARPISSVLPLRKATIIVVDALDECSDNDLVDEFIEVVIDLSRDRHFPFRIFFTSRMEEHIRMKFKTPEALSATYFISLEDFDAGADIHTYFRSRFSAIHSENRRMQGIPRPWPSDPDVQILVQKASGSFIFASTLVDFVNDGSDLPQRKLATALRTHAGLDRLYAQVLTLAGPHCGHFERTIGTIMLLQSPLSTISLAYLLQLETGDILQALLGIQSILMIPEDNDGPVQLFHTSLRDFLTTRQRSGDFFIDPPMRHLSIATDCLRVVTLRTSSDIIHDEVFEYACVNWCHHLYLGLIQGEQDLTVNGGLLMSRLIDFESLSLGRWIETLVRNNQLRDTLDILHLALMCLKKITNCSPQFIQVLSNVESISMQSIPISTQDIIIAIVGATGVGKSTFIKTAIRNGLPAATEQDLDSCTQKVQTVRCRNPYEPDGHAIVFVDTPGFEQDWKTDFEVLETIADWLKTTYNHGITITGLLFLHPIFDHRTIHLQRYAKGVEKLCGTDALQLVILATTMWDTVTKPIGEVREEELRTQFWKSMIASGSRMERFDNTCQSAWGILGQFTGVGRPLLLQMEMVDERKPLKWTAIGSMLQRFVRCLVPRKFGQRRSSESTNSSQVIKEIVVKQPKQRSGYYRAIQKSAETAQRGCSFASDAIDFCERLLKAEDSVETLRVGLDNINDVAKYAHQDAQDMYQQFKDIRVELFKILKDIPLGALSSETDKNNLAQFLQASDDLGSLIHNVGSFVNWWGDMNMSLTNLEEIQPQVRVDGTNLFRTVTITERWKAVHKNYVWYQRQISGMEDSDSYQNFGRFGRPYPY